MQWEARSGLQLHHPVLLETSQVRGAGVGGVPGKSVPGWYCSARASIHISLFGATLQTSARLLGVYKRFNGLVMCSVVSFAVSKVVYDK